MGNVESAAVIESERSCTSAMSVVSVTDATISKAMSYGYEHPWNRSENNLSRSTQLAQIHRIKLSKDEEDEDEEEEPQEEDEHADPLRLDLIMCPVSELNNNRTALITYAYEVNNLDGLAVPMGSILASFAAHHSVEIAEGKPKDSDHVTIRPALPLTSLAFETKLQGKIDRLWLLEVPRELTEETMIEVYYTLALHAEKLVDNEKPYEITLPLLCYNAEHIIPLNVVIQEFLSFAFFAANVCMKSPHFLSKINVLVPHASVYTDVLRGFEAEASAIEILNDKQGNTLKPIMERLRKFLETHASIQAHEMIVDNLRSIVQTIDQYEDEWLQDRVDQQLAFLVCNSSLHLANAFIQMFSHVPGFDSQRSLKDKINYLRKYSIDDFARMRSNPQPAWSFPLGQSAPKKDGVFYLSAEQESHLKILNRVGGKSVHSAFSATINAVDTIYVLKSVDRILQLMDEESLQREVREQRHIQMAVQTGLLADKDIISKYKRTA